MKHRRALLIGLAALSAGGWARAGSYEDFFKAVSVDNAAGVQALLQRGFDPNSRSEEGQVALTLCLRDDAMKVAELLLSSPQLQVDAANAAGETPLMMAALKGLTDWLPRLVERGAQINREGWTPLHYAATGPEPKAVAWLLERGAQIDARSPNATTPLMMAARYGNEQSAQMLLQRGADPKLRNQRELTAADFARLAGRDRLAAQLAQAAR
ncbi:ankyrin repeat domain-containing protein [Aquincola sp. S2]|uniref:Ankyrin repeat domain-containing protein n=1 Tax=Pseudaquabacterium terrae TaxID=2732868 RepID=A0ABX2EMS2_9BURK|nr:ankyrin repeat domain-containing protein [Aquabacterium terrae]NRF69789.1 ankyrin repeat domain-containing protein [Aquabacterium terrae]